MTVRHVNAIAGSLSLRPPQRRSLEINLVARQTIDIPRILVLALWSS